MVVRAAWSRRVPGAVTSGVALLGIVLAGCSSPSRAPDMGTDGGLHDAGPMDGGAASDSDMQGDAPGDASPLDVDAADARPPPLGWALTPELERHDMRPCGEWDPVEPTPRELPADTTPRQLWRYFAYDDPLYRASGLLNQYVSPKLSVGPDGSVYVVGPEVDRVMKIGPDGRLRWMTGGGLQPDVERLTIAPDGSVLFTTRDARSEMSLVRLASEDGNVISRRRLGTVEGEASIPWPVATGPQGSVYLVLIDGAIEASCFGRDERRWRLRFRDENGRYAGPRLLTVLPDGSLWAYLSNRQSVRIASDATVLGWLSDEPIASSAYRTTVVRENEHVVSHYDRVNVRHDVWRNGRSAFEIGPSTSDLLLRPSPTGSYWVHEWDTGRQAIHADGEVISMSPQPWVLFQALAFAHDGSAFGARYSRSSADPARSDVIRVAESGDSAWSMRGSGADLSDPVRPGYETGYEIVLHSNGVLYVFATQSWNNYVLAFQTDQLPPTELGCWDFDCNPRRNNWIGSP